MSNQDTQKQRRIEKFLEGYGKLVKELEVDIMAIPQFLPDDKGGWRLVVQSQPVDLREMKEATLDKAFISK